MSLKDKFSDRGPWFTTNSGVHFYLFDPKQDEVRIQDIATHLSVLTRFGGALGVPYTVGHHSLIMSYIAQYRRWDPIEAFICLMHDATEAYVGDVVRPFKQALPEVKEAEKNVADIIGEKYGIILHPLEPDIDMLDKRICKHEAGYFELSTDGWSDPAFRDLTPFTENEQLIFVKYAEMEPNSVRKRFLKQFHNLYTEVHGL